MIHDAYLIFLVVLPGYKVIFSITNESDFVGATLSSM